MEDQTHISEAEQRPHKEAPHKYAQQVQNQFGGEAFQQMMLWQLYVYRPKK